MKKIINDIYIYIYTKSTNYREEEAILVSSSHKSLREEALNI